MKNCRYCYSQINQRAKICPQCHQQLSWMGSMRAFLVTAFPILTAIVSLSFAFLEKYEKTLVQESLVQTEHHLKAVEVQNTVAGEAVKKLGALIPRAMMSRVESAHDADPSVVIKTPQQELEEIESTLANMDFSKEIDTHEVKKLTKRKLELITGNSIF